MTRVLRSTTLKLGALKKSMKCSKPLLNAHGLAQMPVNTS